MKKLLLFTLLFCIYQVKAQWHQLPPVPPVFTSQPPPYQFLICPSSIIIAGDGHILYSDYIYYSPSTGSQSNIFESHDDLSSHANKFGEFGPQANVSISGSGNSSSFMFMDDANGGLNFTKDDFAHKNYALFCSGSSSTNHPFPNFSLTNNYIYFFGQPASTDSFVISRVLNSLSSPNLCNKFFKYNGQNSITQFVNDSVGYILCSYRNNLAKQVLLKTLDYGTTWAEMYIDSLTNTTAINFPSENVGYLLKSDGSLVKTLNGGTTWTSLNGPTANFIHMAFSSDSIGYMAGHAGFLMRTADGGNNWTPQISNTTNNINVLYAFPGDVAYFIDTTWAIYKNKSLTAISPIVSISNLNIYPNPAQNNFTIQTNVSDKQNLQVYDVNGKLVLTQTINGTTSIDVGILAQGVYNVSITSNEGVINKRLVIVK